MGYEHSSEVRIALFDIDGTLTTGGDVWRPLLSSPRVSQWRKARLYATAYPQFILSKLHLVDQAAFRDRWVRLMAWLIAGWSESDYRSLCEQIVRETLVPAFRDDMVEVLKTHHSQGHIVLLASTMFDGMVREVARIVNADAGLGSQVELREGRCTGRIVGPTCSGKRKVAFAGKYLEAHHPGATLESAAAYADSASDIPFLAGVRFPVATYPDDELRRVALERGWAIIPN